MPLTVSEIFKKVGLKPSEPIQWSKAIPTNENGVYVISLSNNLLLNNGVIERFEIKRGSF